jgi:hypothetical protein
MGGKGRSHEKEQEHYNTVAIKKKNATEVLS